MNLPIKLVETDTVISTIAFVFFLVSATHQTRGEADNVLLRCAKWVLNAALINLFITLVIALIYSIWK